MITMADIAWVSLQQQVQHSGVRARTHALKKAFILGHRLIPLGYMQSLELGYMQSLEA